MSNSQATYDWAGTRGVKWRSHMTGLEAMLLPVNNPLIHALQLDHPYRIADIGCGGGGTTLQILQEAPVGSEIQGFDISPTLIEAARARIPAGETALTFSVADVVTAPPPAKPFHRLASRFGIMFFHDAPAAFANLFNWLAPGGRFAFAAWGPTSENPWTTYTRDVAAQFIAVAPPEPDAPGPFRYADASKPVALLEQSGFTDLAAQDWRGTIPLGGGLPAAEAASFALDSFSTFGEDLAAAGEDKLIAARRLLTERFAAHERNGAVYLPAHVRIFTGAHPLA